MGKKRFRSRSNSGQGGGGGYGSRGGGGKRRRRRPQDQQGGRRQGYTATEVGPYSRDAAGRRLDLETFDKVWTTVRDRHYDPVLGGVDWEAVRTELDNYLFSWLPKGHLVKEAV